MNTASSYKWVPLSDTSDDEISRVCADLNVNPVFARMLINRQLTNPSTARSFFSPTWADLHDPFLFRDMQKVVDRIGEAINQGEHVRIYGDYDVDGTTSVALVFGFLRQFIPLIDYYIPDREKEGYGISELGIERAIEQGVNLMIALDCGIRSVELTRKAQQAGVDLIICDHHEPGADLPPAFAILNPKCENAGYPFHELSGCGIGFKLIQALCTSMNLPNEEFQSYIDLVAVSIASDLVPMVEENRTLAYLGLKKLNEQPGAGLKTIIDKFINKPDLDISNVVFMIGPRINAAGRMASATTAVGLLLSDDDDQADDLAAQLNDYNSERQGLDRSITEEAWHVLQQQEGFPTNKTNLIVGEDWHKGVVGIVASRIMEKHYRPTILLTRSGDFYVGSARSIEGFDIHEALTKCSQLLYQFGGHKYAAGLKIRPENLMAFRAAFESSAKELTADHLTPEIAYEAELNIHTITDDFLRNLKKFAPFGPNNPIPVFRSNAVFDTGVARTMGKNNEHLKLSLQQSRGEQPYTAVGFGFGDWYNEVLGGTRLDILYTIEENYFNNRTTIQLMLKDIRLHSSV
ncbi:MAG: single-stranded-DNA-specific exonuclease RecJ [Flavobacteriales bacterium]|nr:single-stranded-DNA-specific exonuclease RecJ [Bacteroidota bacterium]MCB9241370.1 single-stranded-DNA-specific exonuclease RecJ [Flavobacteriales bacterium]